MDELVINQTPQRDTTEFYIPITPCVTCGTSKRYVSTGVCMYCNKKRDAARTDDRRSKRRQCEIALRARGHNLDDMSRREKDCLIAMTFPKMQEYFRDVLKVAWWLPGGE